MATHSSHSGSGFAAFGSQPQPPDTGAPSTKKKSLPQYLSGSDDSEDEEQMGFGYPDEDQEVDESPNTSLSNESKFGGDDDEEEENDDDEHDGGDDEEEVEEDEDVDDEGRGRMDRAMDMGQGGHDHQLRQNINREAFKGSGFADHDETGNYDPGE